MSACIQPHMVSDRLWCRSEIEKYHILCAFEAISTPSAVSSENEDYVSYDCQSQRAWVWSNKKDLQRCLQTQSIDTHWQWNDRCIKRPTLSNSQ